MKTSNPEKKDSSSPYEDFDKLGHPEFGMEIEGRCPLCSKVMGWERKHLSDGKHYYEYDFLIPNYEFLGNNFFQHFVLL